ncbi:DUF2141 domain-containing protein [Candidatus Latescibacterota bacterium]
MKFIIILLLLNPLRVFGEDAQLSRGEIALQISGLRNNNGILRVLLFNSSDGFPSDHTKSYVLKNVSIIKDSVSVTIPNIPYKDYAVSVLHDENSNGELDTNWIGLPKEGVGVSNNVKSKLGPPKYKDAKFNHNTKKLKLNIEINYFF